MICWGDTGFSQMKIPDDINGGKNDVVNVSAGGYHVCAFTKERMGRCWGDNLHGQMNLAMRDRSEIMEVYTGQWVTC